MSENIHENIRKLTDLSEMRQTIYDALGLLEREEISDKVDEATEILWNEHERLGEEMCMLEDRIAGGKFDTGMAYGRENDMALLKTASYTKMTLETLQQIVRSGNAENYLKVGEQVVLTFDGEETAFDVIGFDVETPESENVRHTMTLQMHDLIEPHTYNSKGNDWKFSDMRAYLNGEEFRNRFKEDIGKYTVAVKHHAEDPEGTETVEHVFLLSKEEFNEELTKYPYYRREINRIKADKDGEVWPHWTRSANRGNSYYAWYVLSSGYVSNYGVAVTAIRCAPALVIG